MEYDDYPLVCESLIVLVFWIGGHDIFGPKKLSKQALKEKDKRLIKK